MSTLIMSQCWPLQMPPTPKAVLISLADNANDHGMCWPSVATIAQRTCFSERAVHNAIKWLEQHQALAADRSNGRHTSYVVTPACYQSPPQELRGSDGGELCTTPAGGAGVVRGNRIGTRAEGCKPLHEVQGSAPGTPARDAPTPARGAGVPLHEVQSPLHEVQTNRQEPSLEPSLNRKGQSSLDSFALPQWISAGAWAGYLEMRRKIGKAPTTRARDLVVAELVKLREKGHDANAVLDQSTRNSWVDVYPLKGESGKAPIPWHATDAGVTEKGAEFGIKALPGESAMQFKQRVLVAVDKAGQQERPKPRPAVVVRETVEQIERDGKREIPEADRTRLLEAVGLRRRVPV